MPHPTPPPPKKKQKQQQQQQQKKPGEIMFYLKVKRKLQTKLKVT